MALPPLPENNTPRLWVQYNSGTGIHEMLFRSVVGADKAAFISQVRTFCSALVSQVRNTGGFSAARYATAGSNLSFPEPWTLIAGTSAVSPLVQGRPIFVTFTGRTAGGRKVRLYFFTPYQTPENDYRLELGDSAAFDAARVALTSAPQLIGGIDGQTATWYPYFNVGYNAYWQRRSRVIGTP